MTDFQRDLEVLINEGMFAGKRGKIRFIFKYPDRMVGDIRDLGTNERAYNAMRRNKIEDIKEIDSHWDSFGNLNGIGATSIKEIKNKYMQYYYDKLNEEERKEFWRETIKATMEM